MTSRTARILTAMTRQGYEQIASQFDRSRQQCWGDFTVFDSLVKDGTNVLDIGCGNGRLFSYLSDRNITYIGVDASPSLIMRAQEKYRAHERGPQFVVGDIRSLDRIPQIRGRKFHTIFMIASFHHIPLHSQALDALKMIRQFLLPEGLLCMENWNLWRMEKGTKTAWRGLRDRCSFAPLPWEKEYGISRFDLGINDIITEWKSANAQGYLYYHAYTIRALRSLLDAAGYCDIQSYYVRDGARAHWWNGKNTMILAR